MRGLERVQTLLFGFVAFFAFDAGTLSADDFDGEIVPAEKREPDARLGAWTKGETVLLWEQRKVFAEDRFYLYQIDNLKQDETLSLNLEKRRADDFRAAGISVPSYLKRVRFPLESNFWFGGMARNFQLERRTESGVIISAQIHGYKLMWEYDPEKEQWTEYPCGEVFSEPSGGVVSAAVWFLKTLKRNGALDGVSPKDYPIVCLFSSKELGKEKNITPQMLSKILRDRERVLREAILAEFSEDVASCETEK